MRKKPDIELPEKTIADRLLKLRMREGLTQEELCERIGYTSNYYGQAERGALVTHNGQNALQRLFVGMNADEVVHIANVALNAAAFAYQMV